MRAWLAFVVTLAVAAPAAAELDPELRRQLDQGGDEPLTVIITMKPNGRAVAAGGVVQRLAAAAEASQADLLRSLAHRAVGGVEVTPLKVCNAVVVRGTPELVRQVAARADVDVVYGAAPVALVAPDGLRAARQAPVAWGVERVGAPKLWDLGLTGRGVVVGSLDSGVDADHPVLRGRLLAWRDLVAGSPRPYDDHGHGTHTLGTACGAGGTGMAPEARFIVAKVLDAQGGGNTADLLRGMDFMLDPDGDPTTDDAPAVVNSSWGGEGHAPYFQDAIASWLAAGITPVFAIGNHGPAGETTAYPGNYPDALGVGAVDRDDRAAPFSSRGPASWHGRELLKPDVTAPGVGIVSALPGGRFGSFDGTSSAAPHVAGAVALLKQARPELTADQVRHLLLAGALDLGASGRDNVYGAGRLDVSSAVGPIQPRPESPPPLPQPDWRPLPSGPAVASFEVRHARPELVRFSLGADGNPFPPMLIRIERNDERDAARDRWQARIDLSDQAMYLDGREWYLAVEPLEGDGELLSFEIRTDGGTAKLRHIPAPFQAGRRLRAVVTPPPHRPVVAPRGVYGIERLLPSYARPGEAVLVRYLLRVDGRPMRLELGEQLPPGWRVRDLDPEPLHHDAFGGRILWRVLGPQDGTVLRLELEAPEEPGWYRFSGTWQLDRAAPQAVAGPDTVRVAEPAWREAPSLPQLPVDYNGDGRIEPWEIARWLLEQFGR